MYMRFYEINEMEKPIAYYGGKAARCMQGHNLNGSGRLCTAWHDVALPIGQFILRKYKTQGGTAMHRYASSIQECCPTVLHQLQA